MTLTPLTGLDGVREFKPAVTCLLEGYFLAFLEFYLVTFVLFVLECDAASSLETFIPTLLDWVFDGVFCY